MPVKENKPDEANNYQKQEKRNNNGDKNFKKKVIRIQKIIKQVKAENFI